MRFTKDHEWVRLDGDVATVGITKHAADQLGDECEAYERRLQQLEKAEKRADIAPAPKRARKASTKSRLRGPAIDWK